MIAAKATISVAIGAPVVGAAPKKGTIDCVGVGPAGEPVPTAVAEQLLPSGLSGAGWVPSTTAKLAHVMRVLFWKCSTKLRLPKKEPRPGTREA